MELRHIDIANLTVSTANMRGKGKPDIANILPSVRARGILVPLIVRANGAPDSYEIVAGKRRYLSALAIAEEAGGIDPLPCAVIEAGDDAAALEASLIENVARLDPDEVTRWETFTRLVKEGRDPEEIALTFGLTELQVKRTLSLGNLMPRIRNLYRSGEIDAVTVKHLTLASKAQQKEWLAMLDDPQAYCPTGSQLKAWLFGGMSIPASTAIFDLASYDGEIVSDYLPLSRSFSGKISQTLMSSPKLFTSILRIMLLRWSFTVTMLIPSSKAICLFRRPVATRRITWRSRGVRVSKFSLNRPRIRASSRWA